MLCKEFPTDEDILNCEFVEMCKFSDINDCRYAERCDILQAEKLRSKLIDILNKEEQRKV